MCKELLDMTLEELWQLFPIVLKEHNSDYFNWYSIEKNELLRIVDKDNIERINHIGSSAVIGLISKPTVDILLEIKSKVNIEDLANKLIDNGWRLMSYKENPVLNILFNKGYTKRGFAEKVYHLHVRYYNNWDELYFRDYLIEHEDIATEYGKIKLNLLEEYKHNRDKYTQAKSDFIIKYSEKAKNEYGDKYKPKFK